jgi:hypothetical protein
MAPSEAIAFGFKGIFKGASCLQGTTQYINI